VADKRISQLTDIQSGVDPSTDFIPIVDSSASETKKVKPQNLFSESGVIAACNSTAAGSCAVVVGGLSNNAASDCASVLGGRNNTASGNFSTVAGGRDNCARNTFSFVGNG
jgi:hypothetical protein